MFYFICRTVAASPAYKLNCFKRYFSSNANQHSFAVSYLINSCGLSLESALSASKYVHFETPERADLVLSFFEKHGFSKPELSVLVRKLPTLLVSNPEKTLLPKLHFFRSKGFSSSDIARIVCFQPSILKRSLQKHLIPSFNFFKDLLKSDLSTIAAIRRFPRILTFDLGTYLLDNVRIMREYGVSESSIITLLRYQPRMFMVRPDMFKEIVEEVKGMGFNPSRMKFGLAVFAFRSMSKSTWEKKLDVYKRWGLSEEEIFEAFGRNPWCMMASEDKIMALMDYLVNKMGWQYSVIVKRPGLVTLSMEKRIVPRCTVYKVLLSKGLVNENLSLPTLFETPEKLFREKFVDCYKDVAPELLKLYKIH